MTSGNPTFASDNYSGVHPDIMNALIKANVGHEGSYGADQYTSRAVQKFKEFLGEGIEVFFVYNGTGANVLGLASMTRSFNSILCSELAHINVDESTAPEIFTGCKLIPLRIKDGKITPSTLDEAVIRMDDQHHPQAKVISISQTTEYGTVYSKKEIQALSDVARKHKLLFHMDGSRISNAAVSLKEDFRSFTKDAGVDVLSFGGTKNGMMFGEAVIFLTPGLSENFKYIRKQGMQLHSKMRFISAQFEALLSDDLWKKNAQHANSMAALLAKEIRKHSKASITQPVDANSIFATFPEEIIPKLQDEHFFYVWNDKTMEVRLMCAFDTTEKEIENFGRKLKELMG